MISPAAIPWPKHSSRRARLLYFAWKNICLVCVVPMSICYKLAIASYKHYHHSSSYIYGAPGWIHRQPIHIEFLLYIPVKWGVECDNGIHRGNVVQGFQLACSQINFSPAGRPHPLVTWLTTMRLFCMAAACRNAEPQLCSRLGNLPPVISRDLYSVLRELRILIITRLSRENSQGKKREKGACTNTTISHSFFLLLFLLFLCFFALAGNASRANKGMLHASRDQNNQDPVGEKSHVSHTYLCYPERTQKENRYVLIHF